jgi:hypothetical protein
MPLKPSGKPGMRQSPSFYTGKVEDRGGGSLHLQRVCRYYSNPHEESKC